MPKDQKSACALFAVFPTLETFHAFVRDADHRKTLTSFVAFAVEEGLIPQADLSAFEQFVRKNSRQMTQLSLPEDLSFEELFRRKKEILNISISARALTDRVNALISRKQIALPKLTNTMLTRLKKEPVDTPHKLNSLRTLAFWLGYERSDPGSAWDVGALLNLCRGAQPARRINEGVRVGLTLYSRGDVIAHEAMVWLKKNIRNYIQSAINILPCGGWGVVKSYDITTIYVDFPKEGTASFPSSYQKSIRNALSVAHQIAIRWALSDYCTKNRFLSIGIAAGEFVNLNDHLLPVLNARLPGDPVIRMTGYTHQCILVGDIRAVFCQTPREISLFNGESLNIWWIIGLWSAIYWDFIPALLTDETLRMDAENLRRLNRFFMYPDRYAQTMGTHAVARFFASPQNALLGIEIAKTLYYRKCFYEAGEILNVVLSINPASVNARALRMMIYRNMAIEAPNLSIARFQFQSAQMEARFILETARGLEEDFYCEFAGIALSRAIHALIQLRSLPGTGKETETRTSRNRVMAWLSQAEKIFKKGIMVSPTGYRSTYLLVCTTTLRRMLEHDGTFFDRTAKPVCVPRAFCLESARDILAAVNLFRWYSPEGSDLELLKQILYQSFERHGDAVTLRSYRPTLCFCFAVMLWDFYPLRTAGVASSVLKFLYDAVDMAAALKEDAVYIYSYTRSFGEMMAPDDFICHIQTSIRMVEACAGTLESLSSMDPSLILEDNDRDFTLFSSHI